MAIAQKNIERIQRMEGYLNDYAKTLEETKKAVDQLREHQESYIQLRDYYSSQPILMIWTCPIKLTFQQIYHVVSCPKMPSMIY